jgi:nucleotide-binding universal stress UspA family protein
MTLAFRRILVPVEFTDRPDEALWAAGQMAARCGGTLFLLHAVDPSPPYVTTHTRQLTLLDADLEAARQHLHAVSVALGSYRVETRVAVGRPAALIEQAVHDFGIDLVVMATHGRQGFDAFLLGSVTEHVVRHVPCPVLTFHRSAPATEGERKPLSAIRDILVPSNFSATCQQSVERGVELAREFDARLHVLHVFKDGRKRRGRQTAEFRYALPSTQRVKAVRLGEPVAEIARYASENHIDLIVMASAQKRGFRLLRMGSVTAGVLRVAPCPVLSLAHPDAPLNVPTDELKAMLKR